MAKKIRALRAPNMNRCIACYSCMLACARHNYGDFSPRNSAIQIRTRGGLQSKLVANICYVCKEPECAKSCPTGAMRKRVGGGAEFFADDCIACGNCAAACPIKYILLDDETKKPIMCKHCGICVQFCPHQCLSLEVIADVE